MPHCRRRSGATTELGIFIIMLVACGTRALASSPFEAVYYPGQPSSGHQTGSGCGPGNMWWCVTVADKTNAFLTYGPYLTGYPPQATMSVSFELAIDNNSADDLHVLTVDISGNGGALVFATQNIIRTDFESVAPSTQNITMSFTTPADNTIPLEFRVYYTCCSAVTHHRTVVRQLVDDGRIGPFWNDNMHFTPVSHLIFPTPGLANSSAGMNVGFYFVSANETTLYLFHREYGFQPQPSYCKADYARILVRVSHDGGRSFSQPAVVATPQPNTPYECAIVDGAAHFDATTNTWRYLGQCLSRSEVWNMCLFTLSGAADPMTGAFVPSASNPVVQSGQLWSAICGSSRPSHCGPGMGSEGTPDIIGPDSAGFYYVTFHGWDPSAVKSARGVAKTTDFVEWLVQGANLPGDAIFSSVDCNPWNISWAAGGCVGGGEGSILRQGNFMYQLIEAPDITLGCLTAPGQQNWVLGLLRSPDLVFQPTGLWQQFFTVPTVVPVVKQGCFIQYHRLFSHGGVVHLSFWADGWLQIFALKGEGAGDLPIVAGEPTNA